MHRKSVGGYSKMINLGYPREENELGRGRLLKGPRDHCSYRGGINSDIYICAYNIS
jgi:hypothetical protein